MTESLFDCCRTIGYRRHNLYTCSCFWPKNARRMSIKSTWYIGH